MSRASAGTTRFGRTELPPEQQRALRDATRLEWGTLAFLAVTVTLVFLVLGSSQAMRTAWIEDLLSFLPPIAFLVATRVIRRAPTAKHPYGLHRATAVAHLVAAVSLLVTGGYLLVESALWWADAAAAILIAASITWDGIRNLRSAVSGSSTPPPAPSTIPRCIRWSRMSTGSCSASPGSRMSGPASAIRGISSMSRRSSCPGIRGC